MRGRDKRSARWRTALGKAHGFARSRFGECGHDFLIASSCKGRAVCPSCNARRMAETAAHLVHHVFPALPARQKNSSLAPLIL
jgi:hypothetical protein